MQITRPQLPLTGPISRTDLQGLNDITVALDNTDINNIVSQVQGTLGNGVAGKNYLLNAGMDLWSRGTSFVSCPVSTRTERADDWWCRPNAVVSAVPTCGRVDDTVHQQYLYAAKVLGNSGVGTVDFGQDLAPRVAAAMGNTDPTLSKCTFTFEIQNNTGASFTPLVRMDTCNSLGDFDTVTNRYSANASGAVANGASKIYTVTIDTSGFASALRNGAQIYIRIPGGALDSNAKYVNFYYSKLEIGGTATARYVDPQATGEEAGSATTGTGVERNYLFNGGFAEARFGANATCPGGVQTYVAQGWWARPSAGTALSYTKSGTSPNSLTKYCAKLTGDVSLASALVDFGQDFVDGNAVMLQQQIVFSCYVRNNTAAQITPIFHIDTPGALNDWSVPTNYIIQALDDCPVGVWTRLVFAFNGAGIPQATWGTRIYLRFDTGTLGAGSSSVEIAQAKLEIGTLPTPFVPEPVFEVPGGVPAVAVRLVVQNTSAAQVSFSAAGLALAAQDGELFYARGVSVTGVNITASGVDGLDTGTEAVSVWYAIFAISDGVNVRGLFSTSDTSPTMPGGFRFAALLGYVRNDASGDFVSFQQFGREVWQKPQMLFTAKKPTTVNTFEAVSVAAGGASFLAAIVPPAARKAICGFAFTAGPTDQILSFAGTASGLGQTWAQNKADTDFWISQAVDAAHLFNPRHFEVPLITTQEFYWASTSVADADKRIEVSGYGL